MRSLLVFLVAVGVIAGLAFVFFQVIPLPDRGGEPATTRGEMTTEGEDETPETTSGGSSTSASSGSSAEGEPGESEKAGADGGVAAATTQPTSDAGADGAEDSTVTTLRGVVRDPMEKVLEGATVQVTIVGSLGGHSSWNVSTTADGRYELQFPGAGEVKLVARHDLYAAEIQMLRVERGEALDGIDFLLSEGLALAGRILDTEGAGIEGVGINLLPISDESMALASSRDGTTDAGGAFRFVGLEPGAYRLLVSKSGYFAPDDLPPAMAGVEDLEIVMTRALALRGIVLDPAGQPHAGARVHLQAETSNPTGMMVFGGGMTTTATTDEEGRFELDARPGDVQVWAEAKDLMPSEKASVVMESAAELEPLTLQLREGVTIEGLVMSASGRTIAGATVSATQQDANVSGFGNVYIASSRMARGAESASVTSDERGVFVLRGLEPQADYHLFASLEGYVDPNRDVESELVTAPAMGVELRLVKQCVVKGTVVDESGVPVASALVHATRPQRGFAASWAGLSSVTTGEDGTFTLEGLQAGEIELRARHDDYAPSEPSAFALTIGEEREGVQLQLVRGGEITGRVETKDGSPVAGAMVNAMNMRRMRDMGMGMASATSMEDGTFTLRGITDGTYALSVQAEGYVGSSGFGFGGTPQYTGQAGDFIVLTLSRGLTLTGVVLGSDGKPLATYDVAVMQSAGWGGMEMPGKESSVASVDGRFELTAVDPAAKSLRISAGGHATETVKLPTLDDDAFHDVGTIKLSAGATVSGRVRTNGGDPVEGAQVSLSAAEGAAFAAMMGGGDQTTTSSADGSFELKNAPAGDAILRATHPRYAAASLQVEVPEAGELARRELVMDVGAAIVGSVRGPDGKPQSSVSITAMRQGGGFAQMSLNSKTAMTDAGGEYRIEGLQAGDYMVQAQLGQLGSFSQRSQRVTVPEEGEVRADFADSSLCRLYGKVLGYEPSAAENPMLNAIMLFSLEGGAVNQTMSQIEEDGSYSFDPLPPGRYRVMLMGSTALEIELPDAPEFRKDLSLPSGGIRGRVERADGAAVSFLQVRAVRRGEADMMSRFAQGFVDGEGNFELPHLVDGLYDVYTEITGYGAASAEGIAVSGGVTGGVILLVSDGGTLTVRIPGVPQSAISSLSIYLEDSQGNPTGFMGGGSGEITYEGGAAVQTIEGLLPGVFRVIAGTPDGGTAWIDGVQVAQGGEHDCVLPLPANKGKALVTVTRDGEPVTGAVVMLLQNGRRVPDVGAGLMSAFTGFTTGTEGTATTGFLPAGSYTLRVTFDSQVAEESITLEGGDSTLEVQVPLI